MKFATGKAGMAVAAALAATATWGGGVAHADNVVAIVPASSTFDGGLFDPQMCVALNAGDGFFNNNTRVFLWECNGNSDQKWSLHFYGFAPNGMPLYQVVNLLSQKCMEMRNANLSNGTQVDQFTCGAGSIDSISTQLWALGGASRTGYSSLRPWSALRLGANMCLDVRGGDNDNGTMIEQWTCNGGDNQQFEQLPA